MELCKFSFVHRDKVFQGMMERRIYTARGNLRFDWSFWPWAFFFFFFFLSCLPPWCSASSLNSRKVGGIILRRRGSWRFFTWFSLLHRRKRILLSGFIYNTGYIWEDGRFSRSTNGPTVIFTKKKIEFFLSVLPLLLCCCSGFRFLFTKYRRGLFAMETNVIDVYRLCV